MYKVFGMSVSGNCHKVRMLLEHLQLPYEWVEVDTLHGETRTPQFLALNPNGRVPALQVAPGKALDVMEQHLRKHEFFVAGRYSIADIALFAYTAVADTGGFELGRYPAVNAWLQRVRAQPNFVALP